MRIRPFRIPKAVVLPGLVVRVRVVDRADTDGIDGDWDYDPETGLAVVQIAKDLPLPEQRYTLIHELGHVWVDYQHVAVKYFSDIVKIC